MSGSLDRARVWIEQGRHDRSEGELRAVLAEDPDNPQAHVLLSLTLAALDRAPEAEREARAAIAGSPDLPLGHYALATALAQRGMLDQARDAVEESIRIAPRSANAWSLRARIHMGEREWEDARRCAELALEIDPRHVDAINVRARALAQLGRRSDADATLEQALAQDPENAGTHTTVGWTLLQRGEVAGAQNHFREALRLAPDDEAARAGLLESIKARNRFYRGMLAFFFWMGRLQKRSVWIVLVGLWIVPRILRAAAQANPALAPFVLPIILAFAGFAFLTWIIEPLFNVTLLLHPVGRHALNPRERRGAVAIAACLLAALSCFATAAALRSGPPALVGVLFLFFCMPLSATFGMDNPRRRRHMTIYTATLASLAVAGGICLAIGGTVLRGLGAASIGLFLLGILLMSWVVNRWMLDSRTD